MKALACIVALLLLSGAVIFAQTKTSPSSSQATLVPGRYQIVMHPTIRADAYLLDTQTGRVWHRVQFTDVDGKPDVWVIQDRTDSPDELSQWEARMLAEGKIVAGHP